MLGSLGRGVDAVLALDIDNEDIVKRLSTRTVCEKCQTPYTGRDAGGVCDKCGGTLVRRKDDDPEAIRNRLKVYDDETAPVLDWYRSEGTRIIGIDALGTPERVLGRITTALGI